MPPYQQYSLEHEFYTVSSTEDARFRATLDTWLENGGEWRPSTRATPAYSVVFLYKSHHGNRRDRWI